jgi:WD40 repeat protein
MSGVRSCAWSPDGTRIASASHDKSVREWDVTTWREVAKLEGHGHGVSSCAWSPDNTQLASASADETVILWDANTGCQVYKLVLHDDFVNSCAWSPDGTQLASASADETVILWDVNIGSQWPGPGQPVARLEGHMKGVNCCAWSPNGTQLVSASHDRTVLVWDVSTRRVVAKQEVPNDGWVMSCAWSPDGTRLASTSCDNTVRVWLAPGGMPPVVADDQANVANTPGLAMEAAMAHLRQCAESEAEACTEPVRSAAKRSASEAEVANKRARRLEGDPEALQQCSLEELRQLSDDHERAGARVREALTRAELRTAADNNAEAGSF